MSGNLGVYRGLSWVKRDKLKIIYKEFPVLSRGEMFVKILAASICGSDLKILKFGNKRVSTGTIVGHEICGIVECLGQGVDKFEVGDMVAIGADIPCDSCGFCVSGRANNCETHIAIGHQISGGFADYLHLDSKTTRLGPIVKVTGNKDPAIYALGEPLACCINGYERIGDVAGARVGIFGAGPIGGMLAKLARYYDCQSVTILDVNQNRLEFAKKCQLAENYVEIKENGLDLCHNFDVIFTACTSAKAQKDALKVAAKSAKINFFGGLPEFDKNVTLDTNLIHYNELLITGSHGSTPKQHQLAVELIEQNKVDLSKLITKSFELDEFNDAYNLAASGEAMKVVFRPNIGAS